MKNHENDRRPSPPLLLLAALAAAAGVAGLPAPLAGQEAADAADAPVEDAPAEGAAPAEEDLDALRDFTSANGKTMVAKVIAAEGEEVTVEREDGRSFTVEVTLFSEADQAFIARWKAAKEAEANAPGIIFDGEKIPAETVYFVIDGGEEMVGTRFILAVRAIEEMFEEAVGKVHFNVLNFTVATKSYIKDGPLPQITPETAELAIDWIKDQRSAKTVRRRSNLGSALSIAVKAEPDLVILFSNGVPTSGHLSKDTIIADLLKKREDIGKEVVVCTVGIFGRKRPGENLLKEVAESLGGRYYVPKR